MIKGTKHSKEARQRMREKALLNGNVPPSRKGAGGYKLSEIHKEKIRQSLLGRKHTNERRINQSSAKMGKKMSEEFKHKLRIYNISIGRKPPTYWDDNHQNWKGDKVKYSGLHMWVRSRLGTPETCEHCGRTHLTGRRINWANKSGEYRRDLTDWLRLCVPCHRAYDMNQREIIYQA